VAGCCGEQATDAVTASLTELSQLAIRFAAAAGRALHTAEQSSSEQASGSILARFLP